MRALLLVFVPMVLSGCGYGLTLEPDGDLADPSTGPAVPDEQEAESDVGDEGGGTLPSTSVNLDGKLYSIAPASLHVVEPPGLDGLFAEVLDRDVLVYVENESTYEIQLAVALAGRNGQQDPCESVRSFPAGDWSENPVFDVGPGELVTSFGGHPAVFRDLALSGVFDENAAAWRDGTLSAQLDTRELAPALGDVSDVCGLVEDLGGACVACDDGEPACFTLRIEDIVAETVEAGFDATPDARSCG